MNLVMVSRHNVAIRGTRSAGDIASRTERVHYEMAQPSIAEGDQGVQGRTVVSTVEVSTVEVTTVDVCIQGMASAGIVSWSALINARAAVIPSSGVMARPAA